MPIVKISDLPTGDTTFTDKDIVLVVDFEDSTTKSVRASTVRNYVLEESLINDMIDERLRHHGLIT
jgi:hypothetical protein